MENNNTSRRKFLAGLATTSIALPISASTPKPSHSTIPTLDEVKPGIQCALRGYLMKWMYEDDLTQEGLDLIKNDIEGLVYPLEMDGIVEECKVVVSKDTNGYVRAKIGLKPHGCDEYKIWWELYIAHITTKWGDSI